MSAAVAIDAELEGIRRQRALLFQIGYRPVPLFSPDSTVPGAGKRPVHRAWPELAAQNPPACTLQTAQPNAANTGILTTGLRVLDADVDDHDLARRIRELAQERLGPTLTRTRGNSARFAMFFRAANGAPAKRQTSGALGSVEILGAGQQVQVLGAHPSGAALTWSPRHLLESPRASLAEVDEPAITAFLTDVAPLLAPVGSVGEHRTPTGLRQALGLPGKLADGREKYARDTILAILVELCGTLGAIPDERQLFEAAWPQFREHVDLTRPGRGEAEFKAKVRSTIQRFREGRIPGLPNLAAAIASAESRSTVHAPKGPEHMNAPSEPGLQVDALSDFLKLELPPREMVLEPVLAERSLTLIHAWRGVGKTWLVLSIGLAIAGAGACLGWRAPRPRRVLLVDGEMPAVVLQERLAALIKGASPSLALDAGENLQIVAADRQAAGLPDLATPEGQAAIAAAVAKADVIVIDNLSTLFGIRENESDDFRAVNHYLIGLRRAGKSVLLVHHQGKGGQQRGSSRKEDALDVVLALKRPEDFDPEQGARFTVVVEKARGLAGAALKSFEATLVVSDDAARWTVSDPGDPVLEEVKELLSQGKTQREIADAIGKSLGTVNKVVKRISEARNG